MELIIYAGIIVLGLVVGSFLNVLIYRIPKKLDFVKGRSYCPVCKKKINWFDNVPLVSYVLLRGHCRFCKAKISLRYPTVELTTGVLFVLGSQGLLGNLSNLSFLSLLTILTNLILFSGLIVIFFIDLEHQIIPDKIVFSLTFLFLIFLLITNHQSLITNYFPSALLSFLFLFLIFLLTRGKGMGFGDTKLALLMGLVLGFPKIVLAFYIAFLTGALVGIILILVKKVSLKQKIAFGPFLVFGTVIVFIWGNSLLNFIAEHLF